MNVREIRSLAQRIQECSEILNKPKCGCWNMGCMRCGEQMDAEEVARIIIKEDAPILIAALETACADTFQI